MAIGNKETDNLGIPSAPAPSLDNFPSLPGGGASSSSADTSTAGSSSRLESANTKLAALKEIVQASNLGKAFQDSQEKQNTSSDSVDTSGSSSYSDSGPTSSSDASSDSGSRDYELSEPIDTSPVQEETSAPTSQEEALEKFNEDVKKTYDAFRINPEKEKSSDATEGPMQGRKNASFVPDYTNFYGGQTFEGQNAGRANHGFNGDFVYNGYYVDESDNKVFPQTDEAGNITGFVDEKGEEVTSGVRIIDGATEWADNDWAAFSYLSDVLNGGGWIDPDTAYGCQQLAANLSYDYTKLGDYWRGQLEEDKKDFEAFDFDSYSEDVSTPIRDAWLARQKDMADYITWLDGMSDASKDVYDIFVKNNSIYSQYDDDKRLTQDQIDQQVLEAAQAANQHGTFSDEEIQNMMNFTDADWENFVEDHQHERHNAQKAQDQAQWEIKGTDIDAVRAAITAAKENANYINDKVAIGRNYISMGNSVEDWQTALATLDPNSPNFEHERRFIQEKIDGIRAYDINEQYKSVSSEDIRKEIFEMKYGKGASDAEGGPSYEEAYALTMEKRDAYNDAVRKLDELSKTTSHTSKEYLDAYQAVKDAKAAYEEAKASTQIDWSEITDFSSFMDLFAGAPEMNALSEEDRKKIETLQQILQTRELMELNSVSVDDLKEEVSKKEAAYQAALEEAEKHEAEAYKSSFLAPSNEENYDEATAKTERAAAQEIMLFAEQELEEAKKKLALKEAMEQVGVRTSLDYDREVAEGKKLFGDLSAYKETIDDVMSDLNGLAYYNLGNPDLDEAEKAALDERLAKDENYQQAIQRLEKIGISEEDARELAWLYRTPDFNTDLLFPATERKESWFDKLVKPLSMGTKQVGTFNENEINDFYYYLAKEGAAAAAQYALNINNAYQQEYNELAHQRYDQIMDWRAKNYGKFQTTMEALASPVGTTIMNLAALPEAVRNIVQAGHAGMYVAPTNPTASQMAEWQQQAYTKELAKAYPGFKALDFFYGAYTSTVNSAMMMAMGSSLAAALGITDAIAIGGKGAAELFTSAFTDLAFFGSASASRYRELIQQGIDPEKAATAATYAGAFEAAFEHISIENLYHAKDVETWKSCVDWAWNTLASAGIEGSEELFTNWANRLADNIFLGEDSDFNQSLKHYKAEGFSDDQAMRYAMHDILKEDATAFASGAISSVPNVGIHGAVAFHIDQKEYARYRAQAGHEYNVDAGNGKKGSQVLGEYLWHYDFIREGDEGSFTEGQQKIADTIKELAIKAAKGTATDEEVGRLTYLADQFDRRAIDDFALENKEWFGQVAPGRLIGLATESLNSLLGPEGAQQYMEAVRANPNARIENDFALGMKKALGDSVDNNKISRVQSILETILRGSDYANEETIKAALETGDLNTPEIQMYVWEYLKGKLPADTPVTEAVQENAAGLSPSKEWEEQNVQHVIPTAEQAQATAQTEEVQEPTVIPSADKVGEEKEPTYQPETDRFRPIIQTIGMDPNVNQDNVKDALQSVLGSAWKKSRDAMYQFRVRQSALSEANRKLAKMQAEDSKAAATEAMAKTPENESTKIAEYRDKNDSITLSGKTMTRAEFVAEYKKGINGFTGREVTGKHTAKEANLAFDNMLLNSTKQDGLTVEGVSASMVKYDLSTREPLAKTGEKKADQQQEPKAPKAKEEAPAEEKPKAEDRKESGEAKAEQKDHAPVTYTYEGYTYEATKNGYIVRDPSGKEIGTATNRIDAAELIRVAIASKTQEEASEAKTPEKPATIPPADQVKTEEAKTPEKPATIPPADQTKTEEAKKEESEPTPIPPAEPVKTEAEEETQEPVKTEEEKKAEKAADIRAAELEKAQTDLEKVETEYSKAVDEHKENLGEAGKARDELENLLKTKKNLESPNGAALDILDYVRKNGKEVHTVFGEGTAYAVDLPNNVEVVVEYSRGSVGAKNPIVYMYTGDGKVTLVTGGKKGTQTFGTAAAMVAFTNTWASPADIVKALGELKGDRVGRTLDILSRAHNKRMANVDTRIAQLQERLRAWEDVVQDSQTRMDNIGKDLADAQKNVELWSAKERDPGIKLQDEVEDSQNAVEEAKKEAEAANTEYENFKKQYEDGAEDRQKQLDEAKANEDAKRKAAHDAAEEEKTAKNEYKEATDAAKAKSKDGEERLRTAKIKGDYAQAGRDLAEAQHKENTARIAYEKAKANKAAAKNSKAKSIAQTAFTTAKKAFEAARNVLAKAQAAFNESKVEYDKLQAEEKAEQDTLAELENKKNSAQQKTEDAKKALADARTTTSDLKREQKEEQDKLRELERKAKSTSKAKTEAEDRLKQAQKALDKYNKDGKKRTKAETEKTKQATTPTKESSPTPQTTQPEVVEPVKPVAEVQEAVEAAVSDDNLTATDAGTDTSWRTWKDEAADPASGDTVTREEFVKREMEGVDGFSGVMKTKPKTAAQANDLFDDFLDQAEDNEQTNFYDYNYKGPVFSTAVNGGTQTSAPVNIPTVTAEQVPGMVNLSEVGYNSENRTIGASSRSWDDAIPAANGSTITRAQFVAAAMSGKNAYSGGDMRVMSGVAANDLFDDIVDSKIMNGGFTDTVNGSTKVSDPIITSGMTEVPGIVGSLAANLAILEAETREAAKARETIAGYQSRVDSARKQLENAIKTEISESATEVTDARNNLRTRLAEIENRLGVIKNREITNPESALEYEGEVQGLRNERQRLLNQVYNINAAEARYNRALDRLNTARNTMYVNDYYTVIGGSNYEGSAGTSGLTGRNNNVGRTGSSGSAAVYAGGSTGNVQGSTTGSTRQAFSTPTEILSKNGITLKGEVAFDTAGKTPQQIANDKSIPATLRNSILHAMRNGLGRVIITRGELSNGKTMINDKGKEVPQPIGGFYDTITENGKERAVVVLNQDRLTENNIRHEFVHHMMRKMSNAQKRDFLRSSIQIMFQGREDLFRGVFETYKVDYATAYGRTVDEEGRVDQDLAYKIYEEMVADFYAGIPRFVNNAEFAKAMAPLFTEARIRLTDHFERMGLEDYARAKWTDQVYESESLLDINSFGEAEAPYGQEYAEAKPQPRPGTYQADLKNRTITDVDTGRTIQYSVDSTEVGTYDLADFSEAQDVDGGPLFQVYAFDHDEPEYKRMLTEWGGMSEQEINNLFQTVDAAMDTIKENLEALDYAWEADIDDRGFLPVKPNSDKLYKVSQDFSTLCRKRLLQMAVQNELQAALNRALTRDEGIAIRNALVAIQEEGKQIEVACALCYVESARMKTPEQIQKFLDNREKVIRDYFASKDKAESKKRIAEADAAERDKIAKEHGDENGMVVGKDGNLYDVRDPKATPMNKLPKQWSDQIKVARREAKSQHKFTPEQQRIVDIANSMSISDFTSPKGLENLAKNHRELFDAYTSFVRAAAHSKGIEDDTWWRVGDSATISDRLIEQMNAENGLRTQSWSDFQVKHLMDYIAATIELSTRGAQQHAYTKVPDYVDLMGNTGVMINMSLIPTREFNGTLRYDDVEGFVYDKALALRNKYHETAGTICIGVDNEQIRQLLASDVIDYIIPYHQSGMALHTRIAMNIPTWEDYQNYQNEKQLNGAEAQANAEKYGVKLLDVNDKNWHNAPKFSDWFDLETARRDVEEVGKSGEYGVMTGGYVAMQRAAEKYKQLCAERGLAPKFSYGKGNFVDQDNYWKLLIDRKMVDNVTGDIIEQKALRPIFDKDVISRILNDELDRYGTVKADQEEAIRRVTQEFLAGNLREGMKLDEIRQIMQKPVDNISVVNITQNSEGMATGTPSYSLSPADMTAVDKEYVQAIEADHMAKAQTIIDKEARNRGYKKKLYHGTQKYGFNEFWEVSRNEFGVHLGTEQAARHFYDTALLKKNGVWGDNLGVYNVYTKMENTLRLPDEFGRYDALRTIVENIPYWAEEGYWGSGSKLTRKDFSKLEGILVDNDDYQAYLEAVEEAEDLEVAYNQSWGQERADLEDEFFEAEREANQRAREYLLNLGYDSIVYNNKIEDAGNDSYIILKPENIKSAEVVTEDDRGNVILPSQRFDDNNRDIRYSIVHDIVDVNGKVYEDVLRLAYPEDTSIFDTRNSMKYYARQYLAGRTIGVRDHDGKQEKITFANRGDVVEKHLNQHAALDELSYGKSSGPLSRLVYLNAEEALEAVDDPKHIPQNPDWWENHEWFDENGWDWYDGWVMDKDNKLYPLTLHVANTRDGRSILYNAYVGIRNPVDVDIEATAENNPNEDFTTTPVLPEKERIGRGSAARPANTQTGTGQYALADRLTYDALINKEDMPLTNIITNRTSFDRNDILKNSRINAESVGTVDSDGNVSVFVKDLGEQVQISKHHLRHGLDRRIALNGPITEKIGEILQNSILINELTPDDLVSTKDTYALIGAAINEDSGLYITEFVVNKKTNEVEDFNVLYSINAKKEPAGSISSHKLTGNPATRTDSTISIADLLSHVNDNFPDILPADVLKHFGHTERPKGKLGANALFSLNNANVEYGLNFRDPTGELLDKVFNGSKVYETRNYTDKRGNGKIPKAYLNMPMGIVQTGAGQAKYVGNWELGDGELRDYDWLSKHAAELGNDGTEFEAKPGDRKWVYPIISAERVDPREVTSRGIRARRIQFSLSDMDSILDDYLFTPEADLDVEELRPYLDPYDFAQLQHELDVLGLGLTLDNTEDTAEEVATEEPEIELPPEERRPSRRVENGEYNSTAYLKPETLDIWLSDSAFASTSKNYAQAYIGWMNPDDFLYLSTGSYESEDQKRAEGYYGDIDNISQRAQLGREADTIHLSIDHETGKVTGHEGRHRMDMLQHLGVENIPVLFFDLTNKTSKELMHNPTLTCEWNDRRKITLNTDLIPLNQNNRALIENEFVNEEGEDQSKPTVRFSIATDAQHEVTVEEVQEARDKWMGLKIAMDEQQEEFDAQTNRAYRGDITLNEYQTWLKESGYEDTHKAAREAWDEYNKLNKLYDAQYDLREEQKERQAITDSGLTEAEYFARKAVNEFGYTPYFYDAGYIMPNGKMLNFSGEKGKHFGSRGEDHRGIETIFATTRRGKALTRFVNYGNIRIMPEGPGLEISTSVEPTSEQYSKIRDFIRQYQQQGYFGIDLADERGYAVGTLEYENNINPVRIVNDIKTFYRTGEIPQQSTTSQFHGQFSLSLDQDAVFDQFGDEVTLDDYNPSVTQSASSENLYYSEDGNTAYYQTDSGETVVLNNVGPDSPEAQYINSLEANNNANSTNTTTTEPHPIPASNRNVDDGYNLREQDAGLRRGQEEVPTQVQEGTLRRAGSTPERNGQSGSQSEETQGVSYGLLMPDDTITPFINKYGDTVTTAETYPYGSMERIMIEAWNNKDFTKMQEQLDELFGDREDRDQILDIAEQINQAHPELTDQQRRATQKLIDELRVLWGTMPSRKNPTRDVHLPTSVDGTTKIMKGAQTIAQEAATEWLSEETMYEALNNEILSYVPTPNAKAIKQAEEYIKAHNGNYDVLAAQVHAWLESGERVKPWQVAVGELLLKEVETEGKADVAMALVIDLTLIAHETGQALQAFNILRKATPRGQLYYLQGVVNQLNKQYADKINSGKMSKVELPKWAASRMLACQTREELNTVVEEIKQAIADDLPVSWADRWNAWRYLAMLGNPRTHVRNMLGNAMFSPAVFMKDMLARGMEDRLRNSGKLEGGAKTKNADLHKDNEWMKYAIKDFNVMRKILVGEATGNKYADANDILSKRDLWGKKKWLGGRVIAWLDELNTKGLNKEDEIFLKKYYTRAFAEFLQARGVTEADIASGDFGASLDDKKLIAEARAWATLEAQRNTYRDANVYAQWVNSFKHKNKLSYVLAEGLMPFTKTPMNILARGVEYSPIGLVRSLIQLNKDLQSPEKMTTSQAIDRLCAGLTGTMIVGLGLILSSLGILRGSGGFDKKKKELEELQGHQAWSVELFGRSYTIDWMAPAALPLFIGSAIHDMRTHETGEDLSFEDIILALAGIANPLSQLSMLEGINSMISSMANAEGTEQYAIMLWSMLTSYAAQGIPTLFGQAARTIDPDRRSTYIQPDSANPMLQRFIQSSLQGKIPGWEKQKMAYVDNWGRKDTNESFLGRFFENFFSPGYYNRIIQTDVDAEIERLYAATGDTDLVPQNLQKHFQVEGEKKNLTAEEYEKYKTERGQTAYNLLNDFFSTSYYDSLNDAEKGLKVKEILDLADELAKQDVDPNYKITKDWMNMAKEVGLLDYMLIKDDLQMNRTHEQLFSYLSINPNLDRNQIISIVANEYAAPDRIASQAYEGFNYNVTQADDRYMAEIFADELRKGFAELDANEDFNNADPYKQGDMMNHMYQMAQANTKKRYAEILDAEGRVKEAGGSSGFGNERFVKALDMTAAELNAKYGEGNIDLNSRSAENIVVNLDGKFVVIPSQGMTEEQAIQQYQKTGENFGVFDTQQKAASYGKKIVHEQADRIARGWKPAEDDIAAQARWIGDGISGDKTISNPSKAGWNIKLDADQAAERDERFRVAWEDKCREVMESEAFNKLPTKEDQGMRLKIEADKLMEEINNEYATELYNSGKATEEIGAPKNSSNAVLRDTFTIADNSFKSARDQAEWLSGLFNGETSVQVPDKPGYKIKLDEQQKDQLARNEKSTWVSTYTQSFENNNWTGKTQEDKNAFRQSLMEDVQNQEQKKYYDYLVANNIDYEIVVDVANASNENFWTAIFDGSHSTSDIYDMLDERYTAKVGTSSKNYTFDRTQRAHRVTAYAEYLQETGAVEKIMEMPVEKRAKAFESVHEKAMNASLNAIKNEFGITRTTAAADAERRSQAGWSTNPYLNTPLDFNRPYAQTGSAPVSYTVPKANNTTTTPKSNGTSTNKANAFVIPPANQMSDSLKYRPNW